jgi:protein-tyrosine kinase
VIDMAASARFKLGPVDVVADHAVLDRSIGSYLREARQLTDAQVEQILVYQRENGARFGDAAMALKLVSKADVLWALSRQFQYSYASDEAARFDRELVVAVDPFGDQAEAFRDLRSQLLVGVMAPDQPRTALAVLSAGVGDGKTYFAANMAIALSQLGGRTLLIDADMRTPRQDRLFGLQHSSVGLSGILSGRSGVDIIQPVTELPSLYLLPVGTLPPNPLELVQRSAFSLLLQELLNKFEHVIVDTPAAFHGADSRVIATKCGSALVLGRRHASAVKPIQALLNSLARTPTKVAGVLLNEH